MTPRLPAGPQKRRETRPAWPALLNTPSSRSRFLPNDPSTISSPATPAADPDKARAPAERSQTPQPLTPDLDNSTNSDKRDFAQRSIAAGTARVVVSAGPPLARLPRGGSKRQVDLAAAWRCASVIHANDAARCCRSDFVRFDRGTSGSPPSRPTALPRAPS